MTQALTRLLDGAHLTEAQAEDMMHAIAEGALPEASVGALLTALRLKGESPEEVRGFVRALRQRLVAVPTPHTRLVDTAGTGGDGSHSLNLSTAAALLAAAAGVPVAKHGNGAISSRSGSADVLRAVGVQVPTAPDAAVAQLEETGFTFLFAPHYHPALAAVAPVRRALGVRTVFNVLGPLVNPAGPTHQVVGAASVEVAQRLAGALTGLPVERAFVVHGALGWDEATTVGPFQLFDVRDGEVVHTVRDPAELGLARADAAALQGGSPEENARRLRAVLHGEDPGPHEDTVVLGAALALEVCGEVADAAQGIARARAALRDGAAARLLASLGEASHV